MKVFLCGNMQMLQIFNEWEFWTELKKNRIKAFVEIQ